MGRIFSGMAMTQYIKVNPQQPEEGKIAKAAIYIKKGGVVAFPTETVYGLGADALNPAAVSRIFAAKGRPADNPLIVHIADKGDLARVVQDLTEVAGKLIERFWPGPLTLVLPKQPQLPDEVTAGLPTVAVRMPDHPVALALIKASETVIAAPSANTSGLPSPTLAEHVFHDLFGKINAVLDGGPTGVGVESTVLDLTSPVPTVLRPGGVTVEELTEMLGKVEVASLGYDEAGDRFQPRSPGMKYTHYSPKAEVVLVDGDSSGLAGKIEELACSLSAQGRKVGLLISRETAAKLNSDARQAVTHIEVLGERADLNRIAASLYAGLRNCDLAGVDIILAEGFPEHDIGLAVMNRLQKAASRVIS